MIVLVVLVIMVAQDAALPHRSRGVIFAVNLILVLLLKAFTIVKDVQDVGDAQDAELQEQLHAQVAAAVLQAQQAHVLIL